MKECRKQPFDDPTSALNGVEQIILFYEEETESSSHHPGIISEILYGGEERDQIPVCEDLTSGGCWKKVGSEVLGFVFVFIFIFIFIQKRDEQRGPGSRVQGPGSRVQQGPGSRVQDLT